MGLPCELIAVIFTAYGLKSKKPTCFNRGMNLVNNFIDIFGGLK